MVQMEASTGEIIIRLQDANDERQRQFHKTLIEGSRARSLRAVSEAHRPEDVAGEDCRVLPVRFRYSDLKEAAAHDSVWELNGVSGVSVPKELGVPDGSWRPKERLKALGVT